MRLCQASLAPAGGQRGKRMYARPTLRHFESDYRMPHCRHNANLSSASYRRISISTAVTALKHHVVCLSRDIYKTPVYFPNHAKPSSIFFNQINIFFSFFASEKAGARAKNQEPITVGLTRSACRGHGRGQWRCRKQSD